MLSSPLRWLFVALFVFSQPLSTLSGAPLTGLNGTGVPVPYPLFFSPFERHSPDNLKADSVVIPLKRAGRLLLIEAKVDGEAGNLVFDTGASGVVFNSTYFRSHVKSGGANSTGITGAIGTTEQVTIDKIEFANLVYTKVRADMTNLGHIENRRGMKILGLLGFSLIRDFEIVIDSRRNQLKLYRINKSGDRIVPPTAPFRPDYGQKIVAESNILLLQGKIGGRNLNFCFDTAAETNVISSYANKNVLGTLTITRRSGLHGAGSAGSEVLFGRMNDFVMGNKQISGMETIISNLETLCEAYGTKIDGMLGFNFMEQGVICINFVKKQFGIQFLKGGEL